jgi:hypothetical protein
MEGFSFVTPVTGLSRPNTGKDDDDDDDGIQVKPQGSVNTSTPRNTGY